MSAHPRQSPKSAVGSKSSSFNAGASSFQPTSTARVPAECFAFPQENPSTALHSSWISRLLLTSADASIPSSSTASFRNLLHESRTPSSSFLNSNSSSIRRYLGFAHTKPPPPPPPPPPPISIEDEDGRMVASFGPFRVWETRKSAGRVFGKGVFVGGEGVEGKRVRVLERKMEDEAIGGQISSLVVQFRSRLRRGGAGVLEKEIAGVDPVSSSRLRQSCCFGPWKVESGPKTPVFGSLLASGGSGVDGTRRRGFAHRDLSDDGPVSRAFQDIHNLDNNVIPQQPEIQVCKKEAEEPFSFWNMGRFKRANFVSSVSPSFDLSWNFDRKRKPNAEDINSSKYRRM